MGPITPDTVKPMRSLLIFVLAVGTPALAHIKLTLPSSWQVTDGFGGPNKSGPCGEAGTPTGLVTEVMAGSQLTVSWTEPIPHPGHFRISIATDTTQFVTPTPVLTSSGTNCSTAPIQSPVAYPTLVDGLFPHGASGSPYSTTVTVPMMSCANCTLQLMQFMSSHAPPCFYYQCAKLRIVMPAVDAGAGDAGTDAGTTPTDAGTAPSDAGTTMDAGSGSDAGMTVTDGGPDMVNPQMGCGCSSTPFGALALAIGLLAMFRARKL